MRPSAYKLSATCRSPLPESTPDSLHALNSSTPRLGTLISFHGEGSGIATESETVVCIVTISCSTSTLLRPQPHIRVVVRLHFNDLWFAKPRTPRQALVRRVMYHTSVLSRENLRAASVREPFWISLWHGTTLTSETLILGLCALGRCRLHG